jgi:hypothetical protein
MRKSSLLLSFKKEARRGAATEKEGRRGAATEKVFFFFEKKKQKTFICWVPTP